VRYDECQRGMVEHALRLVVAKTRKQYIYPATHSASSIPATSINYPAMGQRLRLKANFVIPNNWTIEEKAVLLALKKYGAIVADNGGFFSVSVCPDDRFAANAFNNLSTINIDNFEVIQTTGPTEGPRSAGAPAVDAGADQSIDLPGGASLAGAVNDPSGTSAIKWKLYSGPGAVTFGNANTTTTSVSFSKPGSYTFLLSADDALHTVAYDAVIITVRLPVSTAIDQNDILIGFSTVVGQTYRAEQATDLSGGWTILANNISGTGAVVTVRVSNALFQPHAFYRVVNL
jgi:hypothetical protein